MSLFDRLFKKQPKEKPPPQENLELKADTLLDWLKESNSQKIESIISDISKIWAEIVSEVSGLKLAIKDLEKAQFEPTDKSYAAINMAKDLFTKKSLLLNKIPKSTGSTFAEINSGYRKASEILNDIKDAKANQAYVISIYFKKEADRIIKGLKNIDALMNVLDKKLQGDCLILISVDQIKEKMDSRNSLLEKLKEEDKKRMEISMEINRNDASLESTRKESEKIGLDPAWKELDKIKNESEKINIEIEKIKSGLKESISSIRRPIKKLIHESENITISREQRKIFLDEAEPENIETTYSLIQSLNPILSVELVGLKESERENIENIKNKIQSGELQESKNAYLDLMKAKNNLESKYTILSKLEASKREKELEISSIQEDIQKSKKEAEKIDQRKKQMAEELEKLKAESASIISKLLGKDVSLTG